MAVERDLDKLAPAFRVKVESLLEKLRGDGFAPLVWETYRSPERAKELAGKGRGIALSMHTLGLAVDIVDAKLRWNASPEFWTALGRHAEALGLTWGGRFKRVDKPHVQAIPISLQNTVRSLSSQQIQALLQKRYGRKAV